MIKKIKRMKEAIQIKKRATQEQLTQINKGVDSFFEIRKKLKEYKKQIKKEDDEKIKKILICKKNLTEKIYNSLKRGKIEDAKIYGKEFDRLFPDEFD